MTTSQHSLVNVVVMMGMHTLDFNCIGDKGDADTAKEFILEMFLSVNPDPDTRRIFPHFTQATDTENIKRVFQDVREHVLEQNLKDYNLM